MTEEELIRKTHELLLRTYHYLPFAPLRGEGSHLIDRAGHRYLDFTSGLGVNALGYESATAEKAIATQLPAYLHASNLYYTEAPVLLAEELVDSSFAQRVFFSNSGSEANETALKVALLWGKAREKGAQANIVAFRNSFHGRTLGSLATTRIAEYRQPFEPLAPRVREAAFNDTESLHELIDNATAGVIVEPVQGNGGLVPAKRAFLQELRRICNSHQALLVFDEIQCGLGRIGTLFAYQHYDVQPDIITLAKSLGGGLPMGATLFTEDAASVMEPTWHGSTFGGNPLICRIALEFLRMVRDPLFLAHVREAAEHLMEGLRKLASRFPVIREVRGIGLLLGIEVDGSASDLLQKAFDAGLLVTTAGPHVIRLLPPLTITHDQVEEFLSRFTTAIAT